MSNQLETEKIEAVIINKTTVIVRGKSGVSFEGADAKKIIGMIEQQLPGDYLLISDRVNDYSVSPVGVYKYLNSCQRLQAIGIVTYRTISNAVSAVEKSLSKKPLQVFDNLDAALQWASNLMPLKPSSDEIEQQA